MKIRKWIVACAAVLSLTMAMGLTGCSQPAQPSPSTEPSAQTSSAPSDEPSTEPSSPAASLSGSLNLGGSTSVEKAVNGVLAEFIALNPNVTGKYDATGSSTGITNAQDGTYHIGFLSRALKDEEKVDGLTSETFALDGIAAVVHPDNQVEKITTEQLMQIYTGEITNWKELGGADAKIVVVSREEGSGTRDGFQELTGFESEQLVKDCTIKDGNGNVATYVAGEKNAIGYVSFLTLEENASALKGLPVNDVEPTVDNVKNSTYPLFRPFVLAYMDANLNDAEKAYVEFIMSEEGQDIIVENGAISVSK